MRLKPVREHLEEPLPIRRQRSDAAGRAVRGDEQRVEPKELRNFRLVVCQVFVERRARGHAGLLQLDDHPRQAVDEADLGFYELEVFIGQSRKNFVLGRDKNALCPRCRRPEAIIFDDLLLIVS